MCSSKMRSVVHMSFISLPFNSRFYLAYSVGLLQLMSRMRLSFEHNFTLFASFNHLATKQKVQLLFLFRQTREDNIISICQWSMETGSKATSQKSQCLGQEEHPSLSLTYRDAKRMSRSSQKQSYCLQQTKQ